MVKVTDIDDQDRVNLTMRFEEEDEKKEENKSEQEKVEE